MNLQLLLPCGSMPAAVLPRGVGAALADRAGDLAWRLAPRARAAAAANLQLLGPGAATEAHVRGAFRTYARYYLDMMRLAHRDAMAVAGQCDWDGIESLDASRARGRGALVLTAHFGNWDMLGVALATRYGSVCGFAERLEPRALHAFYTRVRRRHGIRISPVGAPGRMPIETLRQNGILALVADRPFGTRLEPVACGDGVLQLPVGAIRLALRAEAAIHTGFAVRSRNGFRIHIDPDCTASLPRDAPDAERVRAVAASYVAALLEIARRFPDQWCVLQRLDSSAGVRDAAVKGAA